MVDFTKSISNEQMTIGLKRLLDMSEKLADRCDTLEREQSEAQARDQLAALAQMHREHVAMLSDSLLYLGAAPDQFKRANRRTKFPGAGGLQKLLGGSGFSELRHQEEKLREACMEELARLKASDEVVHAINEIVAETDEAVGRLEQK